MSIPTNRGKDAADYLAQMGLVPSVPNIRSSDYDLCRACPFAYYLKRRLNIVDPLTTSIALINGSWFHLCYECRHLDDAALVGRMQHLLNDRILEMQELLPVCGYTPDKAALIMEHEGHAANQAIGRYLAFRAVRFPHLPLRWPFDNTFPPHWVSLAREMPVKVRHGQVYLSALLDELFYDPRLRRLYIVDLKTTSYRAETRLQICPFEFQTRHYSHIVNTALPSIIEKYRLPEDTAFGGMYHLACHTPAIKFGAEDRPYNWASTGKRSGVSGIARLCTDGTWKVKATDGTEIPRLTEDTAVAQLHRVTGKKPEKDYDSDPRLDKYVARCTRWLMGTGEYEQHRPERDAYCPVNRSFTPAEEALVGDAFDEYREQLHFVIGYATMPAHPRNFPRTKEGVLRFNQVSPYARFYANCNFHEWGDIINENHLMVRNGDIAMTPQGVTHE